MCLLVADKYQEISCSDKVLLYSTRHPSRVYVEKRRPHVPIDHPKLTQTPMGRERGTGQALNAGGYWITFWWWWWRRNLFKWDWEFDCLIKTRPPEDKNNNSPWPWSLLIHFSRLLEWLSLRMSLEGFNRGGRTPLKRGSVSNNRGDRVWQSKHGYW